MVRRPVLMKNGQQTHDTSVMLDVDNCASSLRLDT
jgi:hypothetical protein